MKLEKLLKSNSFLINSSLCLVLLLCLCYLGISSPVKKTYSANNDCWININGETICLEEGKLSGEYRWNDTITFDGFSLTETTYKIDFTSNGKTFDNMHFYSAAAAGHTVFQLSYRVGNDSGSTFMAFEIRNGSITHADLLRNLTFSTTQSVSDEFYDWFIKSASPVNKCYYNGSKYIWNNVSSTGRLEESAKTSDACEELNKKCYYNENTESFVWTEDSAGTLYSNFKTKDTCENASMKLTLQANGGVVQDCSTGKCGAETTEITLNLKPGKYKLSELNYKISSKDKKLTKWKIPTYNDGLTYQSGVIAINTDETITFNNYNYQYTLVAQWADVIKYTVSYITNGGNSIGEDVVESGSSVTLPLPTQEGYIFKGWYEDEKFTKPAGSTGAAGSSYIPSSNVTLYAQWTINTYTVTYDGNGGTVSTSSKPVAVGSSIGTLPTPTWDGYTFLGWYTDKTGGDKVETTYKPTGNITLYAHWEETDASVSLGDYDISGKYIYLDFDVTLSDLEKNITVTPSTYKVNLPSKIVNGAKITILNASNEKYDEYIIIMLGDVDGSGTLNARDYIGVYNHLDPKDSFALNEVQQKAADVDDNGEIETLDYIYIYSAFKLMEGN